MLTCTALAMMQLECSGMYSEPSSEEPLAWGASSGALTPAMIFSMVVVGSLMYISELPSMVQRCRYADVARRCRSIAVTSSLTWSLVAPPSPMKCGSVENLSSLETQSRMCVHCAMSLLYSSSPVLGSWYLGSSRFGIGLWCRNDGEYAPSVERSSSTGSAGGFFIHMPILMPKTSQTAVMAANVCDDVPML